MLAQPAAHAASKSNAGRIPLRRMTIPSWPRAVRRIVLSAQARRGAPGGTHHDVSAAPCVTIERIPPNRMVMRIKSVGRAAGSQAWAAQSPLAYGRWRG
jgi:hypothetical protein